jgi:hypothetical protein
VYVSGPSRVFVFDGTTQIDDIPVVYSNLAYDPGNNLVYTPGSVISDLTNGIIGNLSAPFTSSVYNPALTRLYVDYSNTVYVLEKGVYPVSFKASGVPFLDLPSYSMTFDGQNYLSCNEMTYCNDTIFPTNFGSGFAPGSYKWNVSSPIPGGNGTEYVANVTSGILDVPAQTSINIGYSFQYSKFDVSIGESGLPSLTTWNSNSTATRLLHPPTA